MRVKKKLDSLMLIDDHYPTNYYHELIIKEIDCTENLIVKDNAIDALKFLNSIPKNKAAPNLIFLDINMPKMDGWEFLDEYSKLPNEKKADYVIIMLTTSGNPIDKEKAEKSTEVDEFLSKPLTKEILYSVIAKYWPENIEDNI